MKKIIALAAFSLFCLSVSAANISSQNSNEAPANVVSVSNSDIIGTWKWVNSNTDFPVYFEFGNNNSLKIMRMIPGNTDIDNYVWKLSGNNIYYSRPAADDSTINTFVIMECEGDTMLLKEGETGVWLEKLTK